MGNNQAKNQKPKRPQINNQQNVVVDPIAPVNGQVDDDEDRMIQFWINGNPFTGVYGKTIIRMSYELFPGLEIPSLCYHPELPCIDSLQRKYFKKRDHSDRHNHDHDECGLCKVLVKVKDPNNIPSQVKTSDLKRVKNNLYYYARGCTTEIEDGMEIFTHKSKEVGEVLKENITNVLTEKLGDHPLKCGECFNNKDKCEINALIEQYLPSKKKEDRNKPLYNSPFSHRSNKGKKVIGNHSVIFNAELCVECARCIRVCNDNQGICELVSSETEKKSKEKNVGKRFVIDLEDYHREMFDNHYCISCGQCSLVCPGGAIVENSCVEIINDLLWKNTDKLIVAMIAPSVRVTLYEEFEDEQHYPFTEINAVKGTVSLKLPSDVEIDRRERMLVTFLKDLGFDYIFDVTFAADLTVHEEVNELVKRVSSCKTQTGPYFPMFTSCCPAFVNIVRKYYPCFIPHLSSCKSPQQMMGSILKSFWLDQVNIHRRKANLKPYRHKDVIVVSIMPCTAKKDEITRVFSGGNHRDVDYVMTAREVAKLARKRKKSPLDHINTNFSDLEDFDDPQFIIPKTKNLNDNNNRSRGGGGISGGSGVGPSVMRRKTPVINATTKEAMLKGTGAGVIFGRSGGVMEAAARLLGYENVILDGVNVMTYGNISHYRIKYHPNRSKKKKQQQQQQQQQQQNRQQQHDNVDDDHGVKVDVEVVSGGVYIMEHLERLYEEMYSPNADPEDKKMFLTTPYFIEFMACRGGCIGGGGNPKYIKPRRFMRINLERRSQILKRYMERRKVKITNRAVFNPIYNDSFLKDTGSQACHKFLHTVHQQDQLYKEMLERKGKVEALRREKNLMTPEMMRSQVHDEQQMSQSNQNRVVVSHGRQPDFNQREEMEGDGEEEETEGENDIDSLLKRVKEMQL